MIQRLGLVFIPLLALFMILSCGDGIRETEELSVPLTFHVSVEDVTSTEVTVKVIPSDDTSSWFAGLLSVEDAAGMPLDVLKDYHSRTDSFVDGIYRGMASVIFNGLLPRTQYIVCVFECSEPSCELPFVDTLKTEPDPHSVTDEGVVLLNVKWATRNVAEPGIFAASPSDPGMLYQWNRNTGWSWTDPLYTVDIDGTVSVQDWNTVDADGAEWTAENDPCPEGWRVPTMLEIAELMDDRYLTYRWIPADGDDCAGKTFINSSGAELFLPSVGMRDALTGEISGTGTEGFYWSASESNTEDDSGAWFLDFTPSKVLVRGEPIRTTGYSVRCVAEN